MRKATITALIFSASMFIGCTQKNETQAGGGLVVPLPPHASAPIITSAITTQSGSVGSAFSYQITASNSPSSFGASGLPSGLTINTTTGRISGTPTTAGMSSITLSATNSGGTGTANFMLSATSTPVPPLKPPVITSPLKAKGTIGSPFTYQLTATQSPTSFDNTTPGASDGLFGMHLTLDHTTGLISGYVTYPPQVSTGDIPVVFTVTASNSAGTGPSAIITFTFTPPRS